MNPYLDAHSDCTQLDMFAPPHMRITAQPVRNTGHENPGAISANPHGADSGLVWVTTLSLPDLIQQYFPQYLDIGSDSTEPTWSDVHQLRGSARCLENLRLRCLAVLSRLAVGELKRPDRRVVFALAQASPEELESIWLSNVRRLRIEGAALPPFGLIKRLEQSNLYLTRLERSLERALFICSRTGGTLFSQGKEPGVPDYARPLYPFRLYGFAARGKTHD